jgi:hypothetical protein
VGVLDQQARVPHFGGWALVALLAPRFGGGFLFAAELSLDFPLAFPSFISDCGLWPTNLAPRNAVSSLHTHQRNQLVQERFLVYGSGGIALSKCARQSLLPSDECGHTLRHGTERPVAQKADRWHRRLRARRKRPGRRRAAEQRDEVASPQVEQQAAA